MKITLNGEERDVAATTLEQALSELGYTESFVATAVNGFFIPKKQRRDKRLDEGDRIEVVAPMQGG